MIDKFIEMKQNNQKITMLTAYDAQIAQILQNAGVDMILVGDSLGMVFQGHSTTQQVKLDHILYHVEAVRKGAPDLFIVGDMPINSYNSFTDAELTANKLINAGADAVKFEGNPNGLAKHLVSAGFQVQGHLGLLPQSAASFKVQGKDEDDAKGIFQDALDLEAAGSFSIVLECIPVPLAKKITELIKIPTIGIGAGVHTDGQVLVINDLLGMTQRTPKFVKPYAKLATVIEKAVSQFMLDVQKQKYPDDKHSYH